MISVLQCVAVCCSVLQCVAVCCSVLQCSRLLPTTLGRTISRLLQMISVFCRINVSFVGLCCKRDLELEGAY